MPSTALLERIRAALAANYSVLEEIAAGGQGHVFRAHDRRLRRDVAIKVLRPEIATAGAAARFLREAQLLARLRHPNILAVHDAGETEGLSYYVMDLVDGETLAMRLTRGPLHGPQVLSLARDLLGALDAAHRAGIVHRDVKPANIFLHDGRAILADFGIAHVERNTNESDPRTEPGTLLGTRGYMSPEQLLGSATLRSDIFSAACVLFESATGTAWDGARDSDDRSWSRVPPPLREPLRRALQYDPQARWADAGAFRNAIDAPGRLSHRSRTLAFIATGVLVAGAFLLYRLARPDLGAASAARLPQASVDLAVLPFGAGDSLGRALGSFVASSLEWSPRWTFRPYREVLDWWDSAGARADAVAHARVNAGHWADGYVHRAPGADTLVLRLNGVRGALGTFKVPRDSADLVRWANAAADTIVANVFPARAAEFRELMAASSGDYQATQLLIAGMDAFELDRWDESEALLKAALARDPRLDRAAFEIDLLHRWGRKPLEEELVPVIAAAAERIPEPYGSLMRSERELDLARRQAALRAIVREYPHNERARFFLLNESFHRAPLLGTPLEEVLGQIETGIRSSPYLDQVAMYDHLVWGYIHLGMADSARSALRRRNGVLGDGADGDQFGPLLQLAYESRFTPLVARVRTWAALRVYRKDPAALTRMLRFGLAFDVPELQRQLAAGLTTSDDARVRTTAQMAEGLALLELGRLREGFARLDSAARRLGPEAMSQALAWRIVPSTLGFDVPDSAARAAARMELGRMAMAPGAGALEAAWILALDDAASGVAVDSLLLARLSADSSLSARYLGSILDGVELARRGRADSALDVTSTAIIDDSSGAIGSAFARSVLHVHRGTWHHTLGRPADADRSWLYYENSHLRGYPDGIVQAGEVDAVLSGFVRLLRAELALEEGNLAGACRLARRVRELWRDADPEVVPLVTRAKRVASQCR
jgi:hypothetical protein